MVYFMLKFSHIAGSSNGRTTDSGSVYLGSNPSPAAQKYMKCPKCNEEMENKGDSVTNNAKEGSAFKEYNRTLYWCAKDDIWVTIESPKL